MEYYYSFVSFAIVVVIITNGATFRMSAKKTVLHFISFSNSLKKKQKRKKNSRNAFFWNEQLNWCYLNATNIWYACNPPPPFIPFWLTLWFGNSTDRIQKYKQKMWPLYSTHTKVNLCVLRDQFLLCRLY